MAAKIIETRARITGEDKLSPLLDKLSKKFDQVQKTAKASESVSKMAKAIEQVKTQMAAIEKFNAAKMGFRGAADNLRKTEEAVRRTAQAIRAGEGPMKQLIADHERAQRAVSGAARAFEAQRSAFQSSKRSIEALGVPLRDLAAHETRLASAIDKANAAMDRQTAKRSRLRRAAGRAGEAAGMVLPFAGPAVLHGTKDAVKAGAEVQSEIVRMRAAGIPEEDIKREVATSAGLAAKYTNVKRATILERYKELRSVLLHPEEASHLLDTTIRANSAMNAIDRTGHLAEGLQFAVKGAEVLGLAQDQKRFAEYLNSFVKAQQVMGKTITPEQQFEFAKHLKASGAGLSDRFKMTTGVSLAQEMGGSTAGVSIDQFIKQIVGGFQGAQHAAAKEFVALGLARKEDFEQTKTGEIKGFKPGRHVTGYQVAQSDPDKWIYQYMVPALEKKGFKTLDQQIGQIRRLFPSARAADVVTKLVQQRESFANHAQLYEKAQGLDAGETNLTDPFVALNSMNTAFENFAATLTSPMMQDAAGVMSGIASSVAGWAKSLSDWQAAHPDASKAIGAGAVTAGAVGGGFMTYGLISNLMSGFGLKGSALALDGSAAALTRAAVALGGSAAVPGGVAGGKKGWFGRGVSAVKDFAWPIAAAATPYLTAAAPFAVAGAGLVAGGLAIRSASEEYAGLTLGERNRAKRGGRSMTDAYRDAFNVDRERLGMPPIGGIKSELNGTAKVTGEAKVTIDIPALGYRSSVMVPLAGALNANGPGSLGTSSPDAASAPVGVGHQ